ncbi:MAG: leucyl/phenylalanyl-tRNA--protein transferase [Melioribacteraceae bacterium]|nr:leucyl/phenylalanyl-tRNA--protein transferase [Melioribacteraceae bacterium]
MAEQSGRINWYMPEVRTIIPLNTFNVPRSLKKFMKETDYTYTFDKATMEVVKNCADRSNTWINDRLIKSYNGMKELGHLHSVEVYNKTKLIGGLYGVTFSRRFFWRVNVPERIASFKSRTC